MKKRPFVGEYDDEAERDEDEMHHPQLFYPELFRDHPQPAEKFEQ